MEYNNFKDMLKEESKKLDLEINDEMSEKFYTYMNLLIEWNEKINLTAIIKPEEIIIKHFIDSISISKFIENDSKIIDVGTGAGFPGIPLKIYNSSLKITLLDSLNKRVNFLNEVVEKLGYKDVEIIHGRAQDYAHNCKYREKYDYAVSRAVAPLNILSEYLIPFIKLDGSMIAMKASNIVEEINDSKNSLSKLNSEIVKSEKIILPNDSGERNVVIIKKTQKTSNEYPLKACVPKKKPL
jgi:16S rRNA (guanine527-N7)-methyltransferase